MMSNPSASPRFGRKLTAAVDIPADMKETGSRRLLQPLPKDPSTSPSSSHRRAGLSSTPAQDDHGRAPQRPRSPTVGNRLHVHEPAMDSPSLIRRRRHTISGGTVSQAVQKCVSRRDTDIPVVVVDDSELTQRTGEDVNQSYQHQEPMPSSSLAFQRAMRELRLTSRGGSLTSPEDDDGNNNKRPPPVIRISSFEDSLDIELKAECRDDDDAVFGSDDGDESEPKLSSSAPDAYLHKSEGVPLNRLQVARNVLSSSDLSLNKSTSSPMQPRRKTRPKSAASTTLKGCQKPLPALENTSPKHSRRHSRPAAGTAKVQPSSKKTDRLSVELSPLRHPLRKCRSTEEHLPTHSSMTPRLRKAELAPDEGQAMARRRSLQELTSSTEDALLQERSVFQHRDIASPAPSSSSTSSSSTTDASAESPMSSPLERRKQRTSDDLEPGCSSRVSHHKSPLNLKTVSKITKFITAASASSVTGCNKRQNLLPDSVTLPPVLDSSGRLRVHRRRDDSLRLAKQALQSESDDWMHTKKDNRGRKP